MDLKQLREKMFNNLPKSKSSILIIIGIIGLILILLSSFSTNEESKTNDKPSVVASKNIENDEKYVSDMEARLEGVLSDMLGGTKVNVLITLESGSRYVYANETKTQVGTKDDLNSQKTEQSDSNQETFVIIKDSNGAEQALLVTEIMPKIRGVVIVCDSGQTDFVSSAVRAAVQSALDISPEKICIIGRY